MLPFLNLSGDAESDYFSDGMTEDLIAALSKIRQLRVVSRTSSMAYRGSSKTLPEIGRELGVARVLEGSVRREAGKVRITAQLIDVASDRHLWGDTYDRDLADIFEIQRDVADRIAAALEAELTLEERRELERPPTRQVTAHVYYLRGREQYLRYQEAANAAAIEHYEQAIALDPSYALAHAGLGSALSLEVAHYGASDEALDAALLAALLALDLDPELPEAHKALGLVYSLEGSRAPPEPPTCGPSSCGPTTTRRSTTSPSSSISSASGTRPAAGNDGPRPHARISGSSESPQVSGFGSKR